MCEFEEKEKSKKKDDWRKISKAKKKTSYFAQIGGKGFYFQKMRGKNTHTEGEILLLSSLSFGLQFILWVINKEC